MDEMKSQRFSAFFEPRSVVVIGASATAGKPGNDVIRNILANEFTGKLYLVNPRGGEILGQPVLPAIAGLPEGIDLGIIILPAKETPQALRECCDKGIRHFVLSAGGFAEYDEYGTQIQQELIDIIREKKIRVLGPTPRGTPPRLTSSPPRFFPSGKFAAERSLTSPRPAISPPIP